MELLATDRTLSSSLPASRSNCVIPAVDARAVRLTVPPGPLDEAFVRAAGHAARELAAPVHDALVDFADAPGPAAALMLRRVPIGRIPATPPEPGAHDREGPRQRVHAPHRCPAPRRADRLPPGARRRARAGHRAGSSRRVPAALDVVVGHAPVAHGDRVPPAQAAVRPAGLPAGRPARSHDALFDCRGLAASRRRDRRVARAAIPHASRCIVLARSVHGASSGHRWLSSPAPTTTPRSRTTRT